MKGRGLQSPGPLRTPCRVRESSRAGEGCVIPRVALLRWATVFLKSRCGASDRKPQTMVTSARAESVCFRLMYTKRSAQQPRAARCGRKHALPCRALLQLGHTLRGAECGGCKSRISFKVTSSPKYICMPKLSPVRRL